MKKLNTISKIFLYLSTLSVILWLGSYVARLALSYQLFQGHEFALNYYLNTQNLSAVFLTLNVNTILTDVSYLVFILSYIIFLASSHLSLKENGWLLIVTLIILITLPFEAFLITIDYKVYQLLQSNFNSMDILNLYIKRFKVLGSFPIVELISYFAIIFLVLFKPLRANKVKS